MTQQLGEKERLVNDVESWPSTYQNAHSFEHECCARQMPDDIRAWRIGRIFCSAVPLFFAAPGIVSLASCVGSGNYLSSPGIVATSNGLGITLAVTTICLNGTSRCFSNSKTYKLDASMVSAANISIGLGLLALATNAIFFTLPFALCHETPSF